MSNSIPIGNTYCNVQQFCGLAAGHKEHVQQLGAWDTFHDFIVDLLNRLPKIELQTKKEKLLSFCKEHAENPTPQNIFDNGLKPLLELININKSACFSFEFITEGCDELKQRIIYEDKREKQISSWITYENNETNRNQIETIKKTYLSLKEHNEINYKSEIYKIDQDLLSSSKNIIFLCETSEIYDQELSIAATDSLLKNLIEQKEKTKKIFLENINNMINIHTSYLTKKESSNKKQLVELEKYVVNRLLESSPLEFVTGNDLLSRPINEVNLINNSAQLFLDIQNKTKDKKIGKKINNHLKHFFDIKAKSAFFHKLKKEIDILIKKEMLQELDIISKKSNTIIEKNHNEIERTFSDCVGTIMKNLIREIDKLNGLQTYDNKTFQINITLDNVTLEKQITLYTQLTDIVKLIMAANDLILKSQEPHNVKISNEHVMKFFAGLNTIISNTQELLPLLKLHSRKTS